MLASFPDPIPSFSIFHNQNYMHTHLMCMLPMSLVDLILCIIQFCYNSECFFLSWPMDSCTGVGWFVILGMGSVGVVFSEKCSSHNALISWSYPVHSETILTALSSFGSFVSGLLHWTKMIVHMNFYVAMFPAI